MTVIVTGDIPCDVEKEKDKVSKSLKPELTRPWDKSLREVGNLLDRARMESNSGTNHGKDQST
jgi:hypothetical protein